MSAKIVRNFFIVAPAAAWFVAICFIVATSLDPGWYFHYSSKPPQAFAHPTGHVSLVIVITMLEIAAFFLIVRPWQRPLSILRSAIALALLAGWAQLCIPFVLHMPGYVLVHHAWLLGLTAFVACITTALGVAATGRLVLRVVR